MKPSASSVQTYQAGVGLSASQRMLYTVAGAAVDYAVA